MKLLYTTILACMLAGALTAQNKITLNWIMTDEQYAPIPEAYVYTEYGSRGRYSDEQGRISLEVKIGGELVIGRMGYETKKIRINENTQVDSIFVLNVVPILLPEISISVYNGHIDIISCPCLFGSCDTIKQSSYFSLLPPDSNKIESYKLNSVYKIHSYPNPTNSFLTLQSEKPLGQVDLFNLNGQKLKTYNFQQQLQTEIDLSGQPKGTYVLRSSEGWVERVLKQ